MKLEMLLTLLMISVESVFLGDEHRLHCYHCDNARTDDECLSQSSPCGVDQTVCFTEVRNTSDGTVSIKKSCYQEHSCKTLVKQNTHSCPATCSRCCHGDYCNAEGPEYCSCTQESKTRTQTKRPGRRPRTTTTTAQTTTTTIDPCLEKKRKYQLISLLAPIILCNANIFQASCSSSNSTLDLLEGNDYLITQSNDTNAALLCKKIETSSISFDSSFELRLACISQPRSEKQLNKKALKEISAGNDAMISCDFSSNRGEESNCGERTISCFITGPTTPPSLLIAASEPVFERLKTTSIKQVTNTTIWEDVSTDSGVSLKSSAAALPFWAFILLIVLASLMGVVLLANVIRKVKRRGIYHVNKNKITPQGSSKSNSSIEKDIIEKH